MTESKRKLSSFGTIAYLLIGPIMWGAHFAILYATHWILCSLDLAEHKIFSVSLVAAVIVGVTVLALLFLAYVVFYPTASMNLFRATGWKISVQQFLRRTSGFLIVLSSFGIVAAGATVGFVPACQSLH